MQFLSPFALPPLGGKAIVAHLDQQMTQAVGDSVALQAVAHHDMTVVRLIVAHLKTLLPQLLK